MIPLEYPGFLVFMLVLFVVWRLVRQKGVIGFTVPLAGIRLPFSLLTLERLFLGLFFTVSIVILARPIQVTKRAVSVFRDAGDIAIVIDISGSMQNERLDTAVDVIAEFVESRPGDRIALISFNDYAYLDWPLSADHEALIYRLRQLYAYAGTQIASGLIEGLTHLQELGENPGAIIVVSDGASKVKPEEKITIESALGKTRLFWIWIGDQTDADAIAFEQYFRSLGGNVYNAEIGELSEMLTQISELEMSPVLWEQQVSSTYQFGVLQMVAIVGLILAGLVMIVEV